MEALSGSDHVARPQSIEIRLVSTQEEFAMAMAVRSAVFLAEENNITYADEFNGNDFCAMHLLAFVDGDPAGVIRCRWFADFALVERIGVRRRYRNFRILYNLAKEARRLCWQKGYRLGAGRARGDTVKFWRFFGGDQSGPAITTSRGRLTPILQQINLGPNEPSMRSAGPLPFGHPAFEELIVQREGHWNFRLLADATQATSRNIAAE